MVEKTAPKYNLFYNFKAKSMPREILKKKNFLSIDLLWRFCKWAGTIALFHILQCWNKKKEKFGKSLVPYQCLT